MRPDKPPHQQRKFIIFESCLFTLLSICFVCKKPCKVILQTLKGTFAAFDQRCCNGHSRQWTTQPMHGTMAQGNLQLAAGILFSGSSGVKVINMLKHINIASIAYRTYNMIQSHYLLPAVHHVWNEHQRRLMQNLQQAGQ